MKQDKSAQVFANAVILKVRHYEKRQKQKKIAFSFTVLCGAFCLIIFKLNAPTEINNSINIDRWNHTTCELIQMNKPATQFESDVALDAGKHLGYTNILACESCGHDHT